jgi:NAD(P)-dependent dehydrogenase (short-subunit alcohol dehydrogenase family)
MTDALLDGKVAVVTGGTQGLGEGIARRLAESGAAGVVICGRNQERGEAVKGALEDAGCAAEYVAADLAREDDCRQVVAAADARFGRVDGLVNAAGATDRGTLDDTTVELWDMLFAVNVRAPFILSQEAVRIMKREGRGGSVVNITSMAMYCGQPFLTPYSASKGALATLTKNIAHAHRADRIRCNALNIGWTDTPNEHLVQKAMGKPDDWLERAEAELPFGRLLKPLDVARLTAFLLSDGAEMMTGSLIDFDQTIIGAYD